MRLAVSISLLPDRRTIFLAFALVPAAANAHEAVPGVTGFASQLLHPLVDTEQLFLLVAAAMVAGRMRPGTLVSAMLALVAGMLAGKGLHLMLPWLPLAWYAPLVTLALAGLAVAAFRTISAMSGLALIALAGAVIAIAIVPEQPTGLSLASAVLGTLLTGAALVLAGGAALGRVQSRWGGVALRVGGAWLAAIALLNLALVWQTLGGAVQ